MTIIKNYKELIKLNTFEERFNYLKIDGSIGEETFGFERYLNQKFYKSIEWINLRNYVITRDRGCDLGILDREIYGTIIVHHMNPIRKEDIINSTDILLNPDYLISTSKNTHDCIHFGEYNSIKVKDPIIRTPNDTCPWKIER